MEDKMKRILTIIIFLLVSACSQKAIEYRDGFDMNVGWLHGNCLAIKNQSISLPYTFTLIHLNENENSEKTVITEKATTRKGCYAMMDGRLEVNRDNGYSFYLVESEQVVNLAIIRKHRNTPLPDLTMAA
jgi:hypothetical protein